VSRNLAGAKRIRNAGERGHQSYSSSGEKMGREMIPIDSVHFEKLPR